MQGARVNGHDPTILHAGSVGYGGPAYERLYEEGGCSEASEVGYFVAATEAGSFDTSPTTGRVDTYIFIVF